MDKLLLNDPDIPPVLFWLSVAVALIVAACYFAWCSCRVSVKCLTGLLAIYAGSLRESFAEIIQARQVYTWQGVVAEYRQLVREARHGL